MTTNKESNKIAIKRIIEVAKTVGEKLKSARLSRYDTLKKVHAETGVPIYWISRIENGKEIPSNGKALKKLADYYGIDADALYKAARKEKSMQLKIKKDKSK